MRSTWTDATFEAVLLLAAVGLEGGLVTVIGPAE